MDRKSIIVIVACLILLFTLRPLTNKFFPAIPLPPGATNELAETQSQMATSTNGTSTTPASTTPTSETATAPRARLSVNTNVPEQSIVLTNDNARYTFTSYGGGVGKIELTHYPETVATRRRERPDTNRVATLNAEAPAPTLALLDGPELHDGIFDLTRTSTGVRAEKSLANGLKIVKEFSLSTNYLVTATVRLENESKQPLSLPAQEWEVGTATPLNVQDNAGMMWYDGSHNQDVPGASYFSKSSFGCLPRTPPSEFRGGQSNVVWAAVHNRFFALAVMPHDPAAQVVMRPISLPPPTEQEILENPRINRFPVGYETSLIYPATTIAPAGYVERQFVLFIGPKEYRTLARIAARFNNSVDAVMGFGFWGFFSKALLLCMNLLHDALHISYGWAIIVITVVLKLLFWPLTQASTRSMKRMQQLQPQMKAIQEKYKDDPLKAQRKTMEFMKENKVSPMGGCLPLLLQMPVLIGFYSMIRSAIELRGAPFLWIADLSQPDTIFILPGFNLPVNPLPLLMAGTQVWQAHLTPPSPSMDPAQQKMMRYMPAIMIVVFYFLPSGLTLYYTVQSALTIVQTKLTKTPAQAGATTAPALAPQKKK